MKSILLSSIALAASLCAMADEPLMFVKDVANAYPGAHFDIVQMGKTAMDNLTEAEPNARYVGPDNQGRFLWPWDGTIVWSDDVFPSPGWDEEDYDLAPQSWCQSGKAGWSGLGYSADESVEGAVLDASYMTADTRIYFVYASYNPSPVMITVLTDAAKFALGEGYNDNGAEMPSVAPKATEDWQVFNMSLKELKRYWPAMKVPHEIGVNYFCALLGSKVGANLQINNIMFITPDPEQLAGIGGVNIDENSNAPVEYFDLQGVKVANPENGLYIRRQGNKAEKVVL